MPRARRAVPSWATASGATLGRWPLPAAGLVLALLAGACSPSSPQARPGAAQPPQPPIHSAAPVALGVVQHVKASSSFGPSRTDVPVTIAVLRFRARVRASDASTPLAPSSHWASAEVRVCRSRPVAFGYPAWVLGDDSGRTAQAVKVIHPGFPQPTFPDASKKAGCAQGWVTWVSQDVLQATQVRFEQTQDVPGAWRLR